MILARSLALRRRDASNVSGYPSRSHFPRPTPLKDYFKERDGGLLLYLWAVQKWKKF